LGAADGGSRRSAAHRALRDGSAPRARVPGSATRGGARRPRGTRAGTAPRRGLACRVCRRAAEETADLIRGTNNMRGTKVISALAGVAGLALGLGFCVSAQAVEWYFREPGSKLAADIDTLHQIVMWLILAIFVAVF